MLGVSSPVRGVVIVIVVVNTFVLGGQTMMNRFAQFVDDVGQFTDAVVEFAEFGADGVWDWRMFVMVIVFVVALGVLIVCAAAL